MLADAQTDGAYGYSFILTDLHERPAVWIEHLHRHRAQIEERLGDAKLGQALRRMPCADLGANRVWMLAALTALNLSAMVCDLCPAAGHPGRRRPTRRSGAPPRPSGAASASPPGSSTAPARRSCACPPASATPTSSAPPTTLRSRSQHPDRAAARSRRRPGRTADLGDPADPARSTRRGRPAVPQHPHRSSPTPGHPAADPPHRRPRPHRPLLTDLGLSSRPAPGAARCRPPRS